MTLGQLLREARNRARLTQSEASKATGIAQPNISAYENDLANPQVVILQRLCAAYKTTVSKLTRNLDEAV